MVGHHVSIRVLQTNVRTRNYYPHPTSDSYSWLPHTHTHAHARSQDNANAPILGIDAEGRINEWNRNAAEVTGFSQTEVMNRNLVEEFVAPDYRWSVMNVLFKALQGHNTTNFEFTLTTKTGRRIVILLNANPRRDGDGEICGVIGVGQDITARIAQEQEYIRLIDTANAPIFESARRNACE